MPNMQLTDIDTLETRDFFNAHAVKWDSYEKPANSKIIKKLLSRLSFVADDRVLDVGCGTGILYPYLKELGVSNYLGLDLSPLMIKEADKKFPDAPFMEANYQSNGLFDNSFWDKIIIYNAFPHFSFPSLAVCNSYNYLAKGGVFCVMHSRSLKGLNEMHAKVEGVEDDNMISASELAKLCLNAGFTVEAAEDEPYYFLKAVK